MTDHRPPQNIYDDPDFFAGYSTLERFGDGWDRAVEHPVFIALLPDVRGVRVLDLGCGMGQLAYHLAEQGAAEVVGLDISKRMLALATAERSHPRVTYRREALETAAFPTGRFDLVVSSLAFHYVSDYRGLMRRIADWLTPGGVLVFSTEHPIYTAVDPATGWAVDETGRRLHWAIDNYADEGVREQHWFAEGVQKYHRSFATFVNGLVEAGFVVDRVAEPVPTDADLKRYPHYLDERRRPTFLLIRAHR
ncbi:MAG: class I SAM-dependent methyltransferase [Chloroflexi bacterium]|nr:class I SAM-dependent methyltransferase [Chloroflexota bacterium]